MSQDQVEVFVDYENIRVGLWRNFQFKLTPEKELPDLLQIIRDVAEELGSLVEAKVFGDWTARPQDATLIESTPQFRAPLVLRSVGKKDRTDPAMNFAIDDAFRDRPNISNILLCAGDSDYCEVVRRGIRSGKNFYLCAVAADTAPELLSLTKAFYPIEQRLGLKPPDQQDLDAGQLDPLEVAKWSPLIKQMAGAEGRLPDVVRSYFIDKWLPAGLGYGQDFDEKAMTLDAAVSLGLLSDDSVAHPQTGRAVRTVKLNREHSLVKVAL